MAMSGAVPKPFKNLFVIGNPRHIAVANVEIGGPAKRRSDRKLECRSVKLWPCTVIDTRHNPVAK